MTSAHAAPNEEFLSPQQARALLGISPRSLWRLRNQGRLKPAFKTPGGQARFAKADVEALREQPEPAAVAAPAAASA